MRSHASGKTDIFSREFKLEAVKLLAERDILNKAAAIVGAPLPT